MKTRVPYSMLVAFLSLGFASAAEQQLPTAPAQPAAPAAPAEAPLAAPVDPLPNVTVAEEELPAILKAASAGEPAAQVQLGHYLMGHYEEGYANEKKAGEWFRRAADSGNAEGQAWYAVYLLAMANSSKEGEEAAYPWAEKAADQGSALGCYLMGMFSYSDLVDERIFWYRPAAEAGFVPAQRGLASALRDKGNRGYGNRAATREAQVWLEKAVASGDCASLLLAGGAGHMSSRHPLETFVGNVKKAIGSARARDWRWYDSVFDFDLFCKRYVSGGARWYQMIRSHMQLCRLYRFMGMEEEAAEVPAQLVAMLKEEVAQEPVAANYVLAELFKNWSWLYFREVPCPEDYRPYAKRAAEAECRHYYDPLLRQRAAEM